MEPDHDPALRGGRQRRRVDRRRCGRRESRCCTATATAGSWCARNRSSTRTGLLVATAACPERADAGHAAVRAAWRVAGAAVCRPGQSRPSVPSPGWRVTVMITSASCSTRSRCCTSVSMAAAETHVLSALLGAAGGRARRKRSPSGKVVAALLHGRSVELGRDGSAPTRAALARTLAREFGTAGPLIAVTGCY
ncbi:MAG: hypothetical protein MZW92_46550 [Comamonadaceae bacterium]|nr:hypothetical protein [Comamonadaceae bacterium]